MKAILDCNSFYCSCERLFRPDLWNKPVVVLSNNDGCIISRTDEAKRLGIGMGTPYFQSKAIIEQKGIAVFSSNYPLYGDISLRVMDTLRDELGVQQVEVYSVDEAFLDLHHIPQEALSSTATELKEKVELWTGINVSVGVAPTKVLSKVANRLSKKDKIGTRGVVVLDTDEKIQTALEQTAVKDLWGIGRQYAEKLQSLGIGNGWQLRNLPLEWVRKNLGGVVGSRFLRELQGEPCLPMKKPLEVKQLIATTRMFGKPVYELSALKEAVATYTSRAAEKLRRQYSAAKMIEVFVMVSTTAPGTTSYRTESRHSAASLPCATSYTHELIRYALPLVDQLYRPGLKHIKAGVILGDLVPDTSIQGNLFAATGGHQHRQLMEAIDNINFSQRNDLVKYAASGLKRNWKMRQELRSLRYTTRWEELYRIS